jgi:hypothetical protein
MGLGGHRRTTLFVLAATLLSIASPTAVLAQTGATAPVRLDWDAPKGCPSGPEVSASIARLVARSPRPAGAGLTARARVSRHGKEDWRVRLVMADAETEGERELGAESCPALADAVALVVALAIDPELASAFEPSAGASAPSDGRSAQVSKAIPPPAPADFHPSTASERPASRPSPPPEAPTRPSTARPRSAPYVAVETLVGAGDRPDVSAGVGLVVGWAVRAFRVELEGALWAPSDAVTATAPEKGGRFWLATLALRGCYGPSWGPVSLAGCVGVRGGRLHAEGFGTRTVAEGMETHLGPTAGVLLSWRLGEHFALRASAEGAIVLLERRAFVLYGRESVFRAAPTAVQTGLGMEFRF